MAKLSSIEKNNNRRKLVKAKSKTRDSLKEIIYNKLVSFEERFEAVHKLAKMPRNSSKVRIRNRCEITGRCRGFYRYFKMSRIMLRELANNGMLPGVTKASW